MTEDMNFSRVKFQEHSERSHLRKSCKCKSYLRSMANHAKLVLRLEIPIIRTLPDYHLEQGKLAFRTTSITKDIVPN